MLQHESLSSDSTTHVKRPSMATYTYLRLQFSRERGQEAQWGLLAAGLVPVRCSTQSRVELYTEEMGRIPLLCDSLQRYSFLHICAFATMLIRHICNKDSSSRPLLPQLPLAFVSSHQKAVIGRKEHHQYIIIREKSDATWILPVFHCSKIQPGCRVAFIDIMFLKMSNFRFS